MADRISDEMIEYVGILAKLELGEAEREKSRQDMQQMMDYFDKLKELDVDGVEPLSHIFPLYNVFREDVVTGTDESKAMLSNAPRKKEGQYQVPKTLE